MSVHSAVSVIIPTWNGRDSLDVCLPFLQAQTLRDFETIVVDDGSTDGTVAWLRPAYSINEARRFALGFVTTSSTFYRAWLKRIEWDINAWRLREPGDWNRLRKIRYIGADAQRHPEPLLRHYRERNDASRTP